MKVSDRYKVLLLLLPLFFTVAAFGQSPCGTMLLTADTVVFPGSPVCLAAQGMLEYHWSPDTLFADPGLAVQTVVPDTSATYHVTGYYQDTNIVLNGDFSMGFVHFASEYEYAGGPSPHALWSEGRFAVGANSHDYHSNFGSYTDHTTGDGNFLIVNGKTRQNAVVWTQTVGVTPNTDYAFVTWLQTVCGGMPARLQFSINGQQLGEVFEASSTTGLWQQFHQVWNSDTATQAVITILNQNTAASGNDFGLDDISFSPILPCNDSVRVVVVTPVAAVNDTFVICRGDTLVAFPTANDTVDSLCGTVVPQLLDSCPHLTAVPDGMSVAFYADTSWNGVCGLRYAICCGGVCDTAVVRLIVSGSYKEFHDTVCAGEPFTGHGFDIAPALTQTPGMYCCADTTPTAFGCDSIRSLCLYVLRQSDTTVEYFGCDTFLWNGEAILESGDYR